MRPRRCPRVLYCTYLDIATYRGAVPLESMMLTASDAARTQRFFLEVLALPYAVAGDGQLVFTHAPATAGVHPAVAPDRRSPLTLGCDSLGETVAELLCGDARITAVSSTPGPSVTMSLPCFDDTVTLHPRRS